VTLERVLEVEPIDSFEKALEYDQVDRRAEIDQFVDDLLACGPIAGDVLDIGTGTALIPIALCQRTEEVRVMAVDNSWQILDQARINVEIEGMIERMMLDLVDATELIHEDGQFQIVMSNGLMHQVPEPVVALREAIRVTAPAGLIFFRDLLRPTDEAGVKDLVQTLVARENEDQRQLLEAPLRAALDLEEVKDAVQSIGGDPAKVVATSGHQWTWNQQKEPAS
jgi:ubiquinone/menaquinone biosynthesis C-methylase UbiE